MRHFLCTDPAVSATLPARVRRLLVAAVAVAAALAPSALIAPRTAHAAGQIPAGVWGNDISYPQCNKPYPNGAGFGVIGLNGGLPYSTNPCAGGEWKWGQSASFPPTIYVNTDDPDPSRTRFHQGDTGPAGSCPQVGSCHAYNYGWNAAAYDLSTARSQSIASSIWWLDVETTNCWTPDDSNCPNPNPNTPQGQNQESLNATVLQGMIDYLRSQGQGVGIYSTVLQFHIIAGGFSPGLPVWLADWNTTSPTDDCHPWKGFGGGQVWMVQTNTGPTDPSFDPDYSCPSPAGYWMVASDGGIFTFGTTQYYGSTGGHALNQPVVGMAPTASNGGYWLDASDGGVFTFGDAQFYGSMGGKRLNKPVVGMARTKSGHGYWLVASDGGIFTFGDAQFYGSEGGKPLFRPIVGMAPTPSGNGYWLVASDGGIFTFGDAQFFGSTGGRVLNQPVVGMAATPDAGGYWLVASDGGIFTFGPSAGFHGSAGSLRLSAPVVGVAATRSGQGYWIAGADGNLLSYGDAQPYGGLAGRPLFRPIVGLAAGPITN